MGATVIVLIKIMPDSPSAPLADIKKNIISLMEGMGGKGIAIEEQSVAFGLKALMVKGALPEERGTDQLEHDLGNIEHVSSVTIEDYRRAFG